MKIQIFLLSLFAWCACNKEDSRIAGVPGNDIFFTFSLVSSDGEDLLSANGVSVDVSDIDVYELRDGTYELLHDANWTPPNSISVFEDEGKQHVTITHSSLLSTQETGVTRLVVDWKFLPADTLDVTLKHTGLSGEWLTATTIEVNGQVAWSSDRDGYDSAGRRYFAIVKD